MRFAISGVLLVLVETNCPVLPQARYAVRPHIGTADRPNDRIAREDPGLRGITVVEFSNEVPTTKTGFGAVRLLSLDLA